MSPSPIDTYLQKLPPERKKVFEQLVSICRETLIPLGFSECMQYHMPSWSISKSDYPLGYHCDPTLPLPFVSLANQKGSINLYHLGIYSDTKLDTRFRHEYTNQCKYKLDMGKSCIRFKHLDDIPYNLITELLNTFSAQERISLYEKKIRR
ncbi:MAG TPA: DUF1801 domain-containing protein [Candidatus Absconditabacterales bacterium]|nr:DUF1801 domain-containing protein [Candidatus Absconditabacterales bacterium]